MKVSKLFLIAIIFSAFGLTACSNPKAEATPNGGQAEAEPGEATPNGGQAAENIINAEEGERIQQMIKLIEAEEARMKAAGEIE